MVLKYLRNQNLLALIQCLVPLITLRRCQSITDVSQFPNAHLPAYICCCIFFEYLNSRLLGVKAGFSSCVHLMPYCSPCSLPKLSGNLYHSKLSSFDLQVQRLQEFFSCKRSCKQRFLNTHEVHTQLYLAAKCEST